MNRSSIRKSPEFALSNYWHFPTSWNYLPWTRNSKHSPISKSTAFKKYLAAGHCLDLTGLCIPWRKITEAVTFFKDMISKNEQGKLQALIFLYHKVILKIQLFNFLRSLYKLDYETHIKSFRQHRMTEHGTSDCHENKNIKCRHMLHLYEFSFSGWRKDHGIPKASETCVITPPCSWENMANFAFPLRKQRNNKDNNLSPKVGAIPISLFSQLLSGLHHNLLLLCNHQAHSNLLSQSLITVTMEKHLTHAISLMFSWKMANWFCLESPIARPY